MAVDIEPETVRLEQKVRRNGHITVAVLPLGPDLHIPYRGAERAEKLAHMYLEVYPRAYLVIYIVVQACESVYGNI